MVEVNSQHKNRLERSNKQKNDPTVVLAMRLCAIRRKPQKPQQNCTYSRQLAIIEKWEKLFTIARVGAGVF